MEGFRVPKGVSTISSEGKLDDLPITDISNPLHKFLALLSHWGITKAIVDIMLLLPYSVQLFSILGYSEGTEVGIRLM